MSKIHKDWLGEQGLTFPVHCATKTRPVVHSFLVCPAVFCELQVYSIGSEESKSGPIVNGQRRGLTKRSEERQNVVAAQ